MFHAIPLAVPLAEIEVVAHREPYVSVDMLLCAMVAANGHWRPLTRRQQAALRDAWRACIDAVPSLPDGAEIEAPRLADTTHPATVRSLISRDLVDDRRYLTPLGVQVVQLADRAGRSS